MNNEIEQRSYPCDDPELKKSYPCDTDGEDFSYADNKRAFSGTVNKTAFHETSDRRKFSDAAKASTEAVSEDSTANGDGIPQRKGKGRRGGNAAASVVVHSGKINTRKAAEHDRNDRGGSRRTERRARNDERGYRDRDFNGHSSDDERGYGRGDRRDSGFNSDREDKRFGSSDRDARRDRRRFDDSRDDRHSFRDRREFNDSDRRERRYNSDRFDDRRGSRDSGRFRGERGHNPEEVFSRAYGVEVLKTSDIGAFVEAPDAIINSAYGRKLSDGNSILLPFSEQIGRPVRGDIVRVHFYEDKGGRLAATMRTPILKDGEVGILTVAAVTSIGAFLDNGVPKQILLPFKEQITAPKVGDEVLVWIYSDKSGRQAASMRVYGHLDKHSPYKEDDRVTGFVYEINQKLGIFVAVDNKYYGLVPMAETFKEYEYGDEVEARVAKVRDDGKLDLLIRDKLYKTVNEDAEVILYELKRNNGFLPYGDRADASFIEETYAMSKNQFKRALGHLYKNRIVELDREKDTVRLIAE